MKFVASMALAAAVSSVASASFVSYVVTKTQTSNSGINLDVYTLFARFNGATDTVLNAFNFNRVDGSATNIFYHKDQASYNSGVLMKEFGTWNPAQTGSITLNRPFDSHLMIGGVASATNATNADPSWGGASWNRPDVPNGLNVGWFNSNPPNLQGRVGTAPNTATLVKIGQFMLSAGHESRTYTLTAGYNNGAGGSVQFFTGTFVLPAPGAIALLGLAGLASRRRR